jgi:hypothetical protein
LASGDKAKTCADLIDSASKRQVIFLAAIAGLNRERENEAPNARGG